MITKALPKIVIENDYDSYFENLVTQWCKQKEETFKHHTIIVNAMPFLPDALQFKSQSGVLNLTFYSALRNGFGGFSSAEIPQIIDLL